jgi:hypothetical protein
MKEVSTILMGGLGNFMFQVATTYAYGKKYNKSVGFNCQEARGPHKHVTEYDKNVFKDINLYHTPTGEGRRQLNETGFQYDELKDLPDSNVLLYGYFQTEKYFKEYESDIKKLFMSYEVDIKEEIKNVLETRHTCSIHVRRGDYLNSPNHHPTQNMNYYMKAIRQMPKDTIFLIFSDDIAWCKQNFPDLPEKFIFVEGNRDYEDLYIMSRCKDNIICNSTFSWWAAWLNNNPDKKVIAPSQWFGPAYAHYNTEDLYCEGWIKI